MMLREQHLKLPRIMVWPAIVCLAVFTQGMISKRYCGRPGTLQVVMYSVDETNRTEILGMLLPAWHVYDFTRL